MSQMKIWSLLIAHAAKTIELEDIEVRVCQLERAAEAAKSDREAIALPRADSRLPGFQSAARTGRGTL